MILKQKFYTYLHVSIDGVVNIAQSIASDLDEIAPSEFIAKGYRTQKVEVDEADLQAEVAMMVEKQKQERYKWQSKPEVDIREDVYEGKRSST